MQEVENIHRARYERNVTDFEKKVANYKDKMYNMQNKMRDVQENASNEAFFNGIKRKVSEFFTKKLGKKYLKLIKEFNDNILDITAETEPPASLVSELES